MQRYSDIILDPDGQVLDGATVAVYDSTGALATIYADNASSFKANPFTVGTDTEYSFYAVNGVYSITTTLTGYTAKTLTGILLYDPEDDPTTVATLTFDSEADYEDGTVGDALKALFDLANTLAGTANQITVTDSGAGALTLSIPATFVAPGSVAATGKLSGLGTTTNDNASAGQIGEYIETVVPLASAVSLTTGNTIDIASVALTAGDWEVSGNLAFAGTATAVVYGAGGLTPAAATLPPEEYRMVWLGRSAALTIDPAFPVCTRRSSLPGAATIYLVARASFSGGTMLGYGFIRARRVR